MLHPSTKRLIDRLSEMTLQGRIEWTEGDDQTIIYDTEGYRVALVGDPVELRLSDVLGKELEHASASDIAATLSEAGESYTALMSQMRIEATRIARGTEQAISRVLAGLDGSNAEEPAAIDPTDGSEDEEGDALQEATEDAVSDATVIEAPADEEVPAPIEPVEPEAAEPAPAEDAALPEVSDAGDAGSDDGLDEETATVTAGVAMMAEAVNAPVEGPAPAEDETPLEDVAADEAVEAMPAPAENESSVTAPAFLAPDETVETEPAQSEPDVEPEPAPPAFVSGGPSVSLSGLASGVGLTGISAPEPETSEAPAHNLEGATDTAADMTEGFEAEASPAMSGFVVSDPTPPSEEEGVQMDSDASEQAGGDQTETEPEGADAGEGSEGGSGVIGGIVGAIGKAGEKVSETVEAAREVVVEEGEAPESEPVETSVKPKFNPWV